MRAVALLRTTVTVRPLGSGLTAPDLTDGQSPHPGSLRSLRVQGTGAHQRSLPGRSLRSSPMAHDLSSAPVRLLTAQPAPPGPHHARHRGRGPGFDSLWTGESWSSDAFSPLAAVAGTTRRVRLCTGIAQIAARTPTTMAMHAMTLDGLSEGRAAVGIGVSGPRWWRAGTAARSASPSPHREYVGIMRDALAREAPVAAPGPHYPLPYTGEGSTGLGNRSR